MVKTSYNLLIEKLDQFTRKYYLNKVLKGSLLWVALIMVVFLLFNIFEHQFYFSTSVRKILFGVFILTFGSSLVYWVLLPMLKYFKLGSQISKEQAARILGDHFPDVNDRLLNILQLKSQLDSESDKSLIEASINQKSDEISLVPFKKAINYNENKKYLKYAVPPLLLLLFFLTAAPSIITDSTYRIINNNQEFERAAPFHFVLENEDLETIQFEDYTINVTTTGEISPEEIFLEYGGYQYRLKKGVNQTFSHTFNNLQEDAEFNLFSGNVSSKDYTINVLAKPRLLDYGLKLIYPRYTGKSAESISNVGDVIIPEGSQINWNIKTASTDFVNFVFGSSKKNPAIRSGKNAYSLNRTFRNSTNYSIDFDSELVPAGDSLSFYINILKDKHPSINVERFQDSLETAVYFFAGNASDDYGIEKLDFHYEIYSPHGNVVDSKATSILGVASSVEKFDYVFNLEDITVEPGQEVKYFFEVFDNDKINGSKSTRSSIMSFKKATKEEFKEEEQKKEEEINKDLENSLKDVEDIQEKLRKLREELLQKDEVDWQDKKKLEEILKQQEELQKQLENAKKANQENLKNQEDYLNLPPEVKEKQERLQELFEEMASDEMKDLMEKVQEMMNELNKEQSLQLIDEMQLNQENMEKQTERLKELYKQLEVEKEMNESIEELNKLAEELEKLSEKTKEDAANQEELEKKHEEINKEFEKLEEKMKELQKKNDELEFPKPMEDDAPEQMEEIGDELEDSQQDMQDGNKSSSSQKQKSASEKMKQMASSMQGDMASGEMEQMEEDLETLRQLLENIITLSFDQESVVNNLNRSVINTPKYTSLTQDQLRIKDDFKVVEDTLQALSKRQEKIETFITEKVNEVNDNLDKSMVRLEAREKAEAHQHQRSSMKNLNDLALMLSETLEQMQQQMSGMMSGSQMCNKPGGKGTTGSIPMDKITVGQKKLSDKLKKLGEQMKNGKGGSSKEFAEAAAEQAALRKALEGLQKMRQEEGKGTSGELQDIINSMDKQEVDLVNKRLDNELINRQQDILTRLLDAEKAEREREYDNQRKSNSGVDKKRKLPASLEEYLKKRNAETDLYKSSSPELNSYYQFLVDEYFRALKAS